MLKNVEKLMMSHHCLEFWVLKLNGIELFLICIHFRASMYPLREYNLLSSFFLQDVCRNRIVWVFVCWKWTTRWIRIYVTSRCQMYMGTDIIYYLLYWTIGIKGIKYRFVLFVFIIWYWAILKYYIRHQI